MSKNPASHTLTALLCCGLTLPLVSEFAQAAEPQFVLEKVVLLSRHGVRPQENTHDFDVNTGRQWPVWLVPDGDLSGHGYAGTVNQGRFEIQQWRELGLFAQTACPSESQVYVWSSPYQRTRSTAKALVDGMFPGCGFTYHYTQHQFDPILQAEDLGLSKPNPKKVSEEINHAIGSQQQMKARYGEDMALLRKTVCAKGSENCRFLDQPWGYTFNGKKYVMTGPPKLGADITEVIRMQYSDAWPLDKIAFGNAKTPEIIAKLLRFNRAKYDLLIDQPEIAVNGATQLMKVIAAGLAQDIKPALRVDNRLNAPLILYVGHDNNLSQVRALLGFTWQLHEYPRNDTPPSSSIIFERYRNQQTGERFIRTHFVAQSMNQWRNLTLFNNNDQPYNVDYRDDTCQSTELGVLCPMDHMLQKMAESQNPEQVSPYPLFQ